MSDQAPSDRLLRSWMLRNIHEQKGLKSKAVKVLTESTKPEKYIPQKPEPEPSPPVPLPRLSRLLRSIPKPTNEEIQKFIDKITPLYKPEAINAFQKILSDRKSLREIIKKRTEL